MMPPRTTVSRVARRSTKFSPIVAIRWVSSVSTVRPEPEYGARVSEFELPVAVERELANSLHEALKGRVTGDEIGLRIDLDKGTGRSACGRADQPLGGDPAGLFGGGGQPLFAQPVDRRLDIAAAVTERPLAVHHTGAGLLAQLLDQRRGHLDHCLPSRLSPPIVVTGRQLKSWSPLS